ncbi:MAG: hypothetical protein ACLGHT_01230, partial [Acidimicrobiia bacterium]
MWAVGDVREAEGSACHLRTSEDAEPRQARVRQGRLGLRGRRKLPGPARARAAAWERRDVEPRGAEGSSGLLGSKGRLLRAGPGGE